MIGRQMDLGIPLGFSPLLDRSKMGLADPPENGIHIILSSVGSNMYHVEQYVSLQITALLLKGDSHPPDSQMIWAFLKIRRIVVEKIPELKEDPK